MTAPRRATCTTGSTRSRTSSGRFAFNGRVDARLDRGLQLLDIGQIGFTGRCAWGLIGGRIPIGGLTEKLFVEKQRTVAPECQLLTIAHGNGDSPGFARDDLLPSEYPVTFDHRSTRSVASYCKDFADNLTDDTD
nr:hypothetical protein [uncultured Pseudomonas sp.]